MDILSIGQGLGMLVTGSYPIYKFLLVPFWTRSWNTAPAEVIEVESDSLFEIEGNHIHLNQDSDFAIKYKIDDRDFIHTSDIESNTRLNGTKISRSPIVPRVFTIRYRPENPKQVSFAHAIRPSIKLAITAVCYSIFAMITYAYLQR